MTLETSSTIERANLTDEQLVERAKRAGWVWFQNEVVPRFGSQRTGWLVSPSHFIPSPTPAERLRGTPATKYSAENLGFDHDLVCGVCASPVWLSFLSDAKLVGRRECFDCNHWMDLLRGDTPPLVAEQGPFAGRCIYQLGDQQRPGPHNGFAGRWFEVRHADGRVERTCDLWHAGELPERFFDRFPVNAEIVHAVSA